MKCCPIPATLDGHFTNLINFMQDGRVIPFLGAGANLCSRPESVAWTGDRSDYLPSGPELSRHLAESFNCPPAEVTDLLHVSEYVALTIGFCAGYRELHDVFNRDYPPTTLHRFFATWPGLLREKGYPVKYQLIVTTNYDDVLERAFREAGEPFDLVIYVADGPDRGKFLHVPPDGPSQIIDVPNRYRNLSLDSRSVIKKIHGAVDRSFAGWRRRQLRDHGGSLHRLPDADGSREPRPRHDGGQTRRSHFLFLGVRPAGLEPAGHPPPHRRSAVADVQVVGCPAEGRRRWTRSSGDGVK